MLPDVKVGQVWIHCEMERREGRIVELVVEQVTDDYVYTRDAKYPRGERKILRHRFKPGATGFRRKDATPPSVGIDKIAEREEN